MPQGGYELRLPSPYTASPPSETTVTDPKHPVRWSEGNGRPPRMPPRERGGERERFRVAEAEEGRGSEGRGTESGTTRISG